MHSNMCSTVSSLTLFDFARLILGSYWPSLSISSDLEESRTYPLSELLMSFLEESGYMHMQMTKPDTVGTLTCGHTHKHVVKLHCNRIV